MHALKPSTRILQCLPSFLMNRLRVSQQSIHSSCFLRQHPLTPIYCSFLNTSCLNASTAENISSPPAVPSVKLDVSSKTATVAQTSHEVEELDVLYHMIDIEIRCGDPAVLQSYNKFITIAAQHLDLTIGVNEVGVQPHKKRWTVLKSPFGHKKHMVQYEVRTYHHKLSLLRLTGSTADTFLEYIQRNLPEGVAMRVGRVRMERLPDHLLTPPPTDDLESPPSTANPETEKDKREE